MKQSVRKRILAAAEEQMLARGYSGMTMDELARSLGMSKRTLYEYFRSKDKLAEAFIQSKSKEIARAQREALSGNASPVEKIFRIGRAMERFRPTVFNEPLIEDLMRNAPHLWKTIVAVRREKMSAIWEQLLAEGVRTGQFARDVESDIFIPAFQAAMEKLFEPAFMLRGKHSLTHMRNSLVKIFLHGILTEKGRKAFAGKETELHLKS